MARLSSAAAHDFLVVAIADSTVTKLLSNL